MHNTNRKEEGEGEVNDYDISGNSPSATRNDDDSFEPTQESGESSEGTGRNPVASDSNAQDLERTKNEVDSSHHFRGTDEEIELIATITQVAVETIQSSQISYSGPIPDSGEFYKYQPEDRERILRMSESRSTDESARRDQIVQTMVEESRAGRKTFVWLFIFALGMSVLTMGLFKNPWLSAAFLATPILNTLAGLLDSAGNGGSSKSEKPDKD